MRWRPLLLTLLLLGGCKPRADVQHYADQAAKVSAPAGVSESAVGAGDPASPSSPPPTARPAQLSTTPQLAYSYSYTLKLPAGHVHSLAQQHQAACAAAGPQLCQLIAASEDSQGRDVATAHLELRATPAWLASFRAGLDGQAKGAGGQVASSKTETEDLSRSIVDTQATIRAQTTLRDRLQQLVAERTGKLSDVLDAERELARVQGEIDAAQSELAVMQARVDMSMLTLDYQAIGVAAPDGVASPLQNAANSFFGNMMMVFAAILSLVSVLLPIALVSAPIVWIAWRLSRRRKTRAKTEPAATE